jgi:hypothetical protein
MPGTNPSAESNGTIRRVMADWRRSLISKQQMQHSLNGPAGKIMMMMMVGLDENSLIKRKQLRLFLSKSPPFSSPSYQPRLIWYQLVDSSTGQPYKAARADKLSVSTDADVADFRNAVKLKWDEPGYLKDVPAGALIVYKNKAAFDERNAADDKEEPLEEDSLINDLGKSKKEALIVLVPSVSSSTIPSVIASTRREPHPKRKQRWIQLNEILHENAKRSKINGSIAYSYVTWNQVKSILNPEEYVQPQKDLPNKESFNNLVTHLSYATKCFGNIWTGTEAKRRYFIAPILIYVCALFDGEVEIAVEEELDGKFVKAHG